MANEKAKDFFTRIETDPKAKELLSGMKEPKNEEEFVANCMKLASQLGFELTGDEIRDAFDTMTQNRRKKTDTEIRMLQMEELESVVGGALWMNEEAPDGHEMGCLSTYHGYEWSKENDIMCKKNYFCWHGNYEPTFCSGTWL